MKSFIAAGRPAGGDPRREAVEDAPVNAFGIVVRLEQERQQRRHQHCRLDPPWAMSGQVAGHLSGPHGEPGQYHPAQVEPAEQEMKVGGERVEVISGAGPAGGAEAPPVVGDHPVQKASRSSSLGVRRGNAQASLHCGPRSA